MNFPNRSLYTGFPVFADRLGPCESRNEFSFHFPVVEIRKAFFRPYDDAERFVHYVQKFSANRFQPSSDSVSEIRLPDFFADIDADSDISETGSVLKSGIFRENSLIPEGDHTQIFFPQFCSSVKYFSE